MSTGKALAAELQYESKGTRKILERIPEDKFGWKPHEKSMTVNRLGMHIAELPLWINRTLESNEFVFGKEPFKPNIPNTSQEIMDEFEVRLAAALDALNKADDDLMNTEWKVYFKETLISSSPKKVAIRNLINHIIHHRGQLSVFLRLLDVPLPNLYGPTADER
ncbi:MAG TPA: DinB family protein [Chitinophagales bacterium]|nr:DinB family protein [Chitinophagales bacterium]